MYNINSRRHSAGFPINEIFYSLQGEASFAGLPAVFIRFQGCNVGCPFCDTKHTWQLNPENQVNSLEIIGKIKDLQSWGYFDTAAIIAEINKYPACRHVVFTGGEPALYDLHGLCTTLEAQGYTIQIETSGTEPLLVSSKTWVTLSPKINMPGNKPVLAETAARANEIKMPIGKKTDILKLKQFLIDYQINTRLIWLQPLSCKDKPTRLCIKEALENNWRVSTQIHKFINIR